MSHIWYRESKQGRRFVIRIAPGANLVEELLKFALEVDLKLGVVLSAIGSVRHIRFSDIQAGARLPISEPRMPVHELEKMDDHLHIIGSKSSGEVVGGHLLEAEVFATCELILVEYLVEGIERQYSETGGIDTLYFEDESPNDQ